MTSRVHVGVAVGFHEFAASWGTHYWETTLPVGPTPDAIRDATSELKGRIGLRRRVSVSVALLPPIVQVRRVVLPRMSNNDLRLALTTNAKQFFIGLGEAPVCGVARLASTRRIAACPALAFAASSEDIESVVTGLAAQGWTLDRIVPAQFAWAGFIVRANRRLARGRVRIGVHLRDEMNLLELESGFLVRTRRYRVSRRIPTSESVCDFHLVGDQAGQTPALIAAAGAKKTGRFQILPDAVSRARGARDRNVSILLAALASANLLGAAIVYRARLHDQLAEIASRRSALHSRASLALTYRDSARALADRITSIAQLEGSTLRWSAVLSRVAIALPEGAELISVRATADSLTLEGQSAEASSVVSALERTTGVETTRMISPIVRESTDGGEPMERWRLAIRVSHRPTLRVH